MKVKVENFQGNLRLRFTHKGKRQCFALGWSDNQASRVQAERLAKQMMLDDISGNFDETLLKYRSRISGKNATEVTTAELFERFSQHKLKDCAVSPRSIETRYKPLLKYLERLLNCKAHEVTEAKARNFKAILTENLTPQTAKERLWLLQSCWDWAKGKYHTGESNPWTGLANGIKLQPSQRVKPFSASEAKAIIFAFQSSQHYSHYADFVALLFGVGCRFGEAAGLQWKHIADDYQTAWIGESVSRGHRRSTKTGKARTVMLSPTMAKMLGDRHTKLKPKPDDLVFPSPKGLPINDHRFRARA
jgi:integrase